MAAEDILYGGQSSYTSHGNIGSFSDTDSPGSSGSTLDTGDLRRKFNFGDRVSELSLAQDPFFRFVSMVSKKPTDDPQFKFTERRGSWHKRYAYVTDHGATSALGNSGDSTWDSGESDAGDTYYFKMGTDYLNSSNRQNVYGQATNDISVGDSNTRPKFFLSGQLVRINTHTAGEAPGSGGAEVDDYAVCRITEEPTTSGEFTIIKTVVVKEAFVSGSAAAVEIASFDSDVPKGTGVTMYGSVISSALEQQRCYVVGSAHEEGSGYPETWVDQPYSTGFGFTQIWKTAMAMTNTARATVLKYEPNEWARVWKDKLIEHKWDMEQSMLFGKQASVGSTQTTEGAVDFITNYGNVFSLDINTKTADDFLDDLSSYLDPRYNNSKASVFFVNTAVYNWLHKLGGYFSNNLNINSNFSADLAVTGRKKVLGLDTTNITTPLGDMNVVRNIHLDGSAVKMLAINMKNAKYRPLVGNGVNRDTSVYVGVQTLENSGVDRRVDLILTEAGMEWTMPESHAYWS